MTAVTRNRKNNRYLQTRKNREVKKLLDIGTRVDHIPGRKSRCYYPLWNAVYEGQKEIVRLLIEEGGVDINIEYRNSIPL